MAKKKLKGKASAVSTMTTLAARLRGAPPAPIETSYCRRAAPAPAAGPARHPPPDGAPAAGPARHPPPVGAPAAGPARHSPPDGAPAVGPARHPPPDGAPAAGRQPAPETGLNLSRARHEVFQLGLEGMSRQRRKDAIQQKLVRLGAKPPPRKGLNYKSLMQEAKEKKLREAEEKEALRKSGLALPNPGALPDLNDKKAKRPRLHKNKVRGFDSQPGRFKNGVQIVPRRVHKS